MPAKILRKILLVLVALAVLFELVCWIFIRFPVEPIRTLNLSNDIPGFKKNVRLEFGDDQVRYLGWKPGDAKTPGTVRILCLGGLTTLGMLQTAEDTWWGHLHKGLVDKGLKVETAARGYDHTGLLAAAAASGPLVERLQPDVLILNAGFDDVIIHSPEYTYEKDRLSKIPVPPARSGFRETIVKISQFARFRRSWTKDSEAKVLQNQLGRTDAYKRHFDERRKAIQNLQRLDSIPRMAGTNDPLPEYLDALTAFRDLAAKQGAALVLTGEASMNSDIMSLGDTEILMAYIPLKETSADGNVPAARPDPAWVMREMDRFAAAAEKFAGEHKLPWLDLNGKVERSAANFYTDVMLTDAGSAAAAALLLPVVEPVVRAAVK